MLLCMLSPLPLDVTIRTPLVQAPDPTPLTGTGFLDRSQQVKRRGTRSLNTLQVIAHKTQASWRRVPIHSSQRAVTFNGCDHDKEVDLKRIRSIILSEFTHRRNGWVGIRRARCGSSHPVLAGQPFGSSLARICCSRPSGSRRRCPDPLRY